MAAEPGEAVAAALEAARRNRTLGAFWSLDDGAAEAAGRRGGRAGGTGALAGVPVAVKDLFDVRGLPTTAGVQGSHQAAGRDAEAVRLLRAAGAVPIGKTAMDQLAATTGGQAPGFPPCINPLDSALSPGGSSSGSAVAVAAGIVPLALGSDTAGSVRVPAAYCGVVGFKPATRAIPRAGSVTVMPAFDTAGLLAPTVAGCVEAYRLLARRSPAAGDDSRAGSRPRIALLTDLVGEAAGEVASACEDVAVELGREAVIARAELGWRAQGFGVALAWELARVWGNRVEADPGRFTGVIRETVAFGRSKGAEGHARALADIRRARVRVRRRLSGFSAVLCPTVPVPAPARERETTPVSTRFTRIFSALGWPAFSLPAGTDAAGHPIAIQIASPPAGVETLIALAALVERTTEGMGIRRTMAG